MRHEEEDEIQKDLCISTSKVPSNEIQNGEEGEVDVGVYDKFLFE